MLFNGQNMPSVTQSDTKPPTRYWLAKKNRRPDQLPSEAEEQDYFKGIFVQLGSEKLWIFWIQQFCTLLLQIIIREDLLQQVDEVCNVML